MEKKYIAEFLGTFFLVATVIGSGIMGNDLSAGNEAVALWGNTIATGAILFVIIKSFENLLVFLQLSKKVPIQWSSSLKN